jgi:NAD-dependent deacetylase
VLVNPIDETRARLSAAEAVLVLTGAGVSVASGIQVYRGAAGSRYDDPDALRYAFASTLHADPEGFWARFRRARAALRAARPNPAHEALVALEGRARRFLLATQNVDDLHRRAGTRALAELHGNAFRVRCLAGCGAPAVESEAERCVCGGWTRPDVVLFGEGEPGRWEPVHAFARSEVSVVLLVGTSGVVAVPQELLALVPRAWVVEVNPRPEVAGVHARIAAPAEEALPLLV